MKIYVVFIFNVLNFISGYSQDRLQNIYTNAESQHINATINSLSFNESKFQSIEATNEERAHENKTNETLIHTTITDTIPWHKIDLGSPQMKKKSSRPFPWWIPITAGGAAVAATGVVLLLKDDDPIVPTGPIARNDQFTIPCKMNTVISPLGNDSGDGLQIINVSGAPAGWISFTDQTITILDAASQNFSFIYSISDINGSVAEATISIIIEFSPIQLQNQTFEGVPGDIVTHQIFSNAVCTECTVASTISAPQANFTWTPTGAFSFELPNVSQPQTFLFTFTVTDRCMQIGTAQISVTVRPDCDIEPSFIVLDEKCDFMDGSIQIVIDPLSNYQFNWNNGNNLALNSGLSKGIYQVTVTLISNPACSEEFEIEVLSTTFTINLTDDRYQAVVNSLLTGNVLNNDTGSGLQVSGFEDLDVAEFTIQADGSFRFLANDNAEDQYSSTYTVTDTCGNTSTATVIFDVAKLPCEFSAAISTSPADCGKANGSASVIISPAGPLYEIRWPNGIIGPAASGFSAGSYTLIIMNTADNCVLNFNFIVTENPAPNYIQLLETSAATCIGGAQVDLLLNEPAGAGMQLIVTRGNLPFLSLNVNSGSINLGEMANFLPGNYQISVSCVGCPTRCAQIVNFTISQVLPLLEINDDMASIPSNSIWSGNVLTNDFGTGMTVIGFTQPSAGVASVNSSGLTVFNPPVGFSGTVSFNYTVRDTCGQEKSAVVTINVETVPCDFTVQFSNIPANCGQMDGSSTISITPQGNSYQVSWSDGVLGLINPMLSPGSYTVTISNLNAACTQVLTTLIEELPPPDLIQEVNTTSSSCLDDGSAAFTILNFKSIDIVVEIYLNNQFVFSISIPAFGTVTEELDSLSEGTYLLQALESGSPRRCADNEVFEIGTTILPMMLLDDNHTIPFGTVWIGNVLSNDIGTGLQVNGFTPTPHGTVQILSNGVSTFLPNPGFSGTATFLYFARDTCKQEQMATVNITVLPSIGNLQQNILSVLTSFEFFQQANGLMNTSPANSPEGIPSQQFYNLSGFQNGLRYNVMHKQWLLRGEVSYGESVSGDVQSKMLSRNNIEARLGVGRFHDFNGHRIMVESGIASSRSRMVLSNSFSSIMFRHSLKAFYFKAEYQLNLKSGYCIFWEPQLFYLPGNQQWAGMMSSGFKFIFE